MFFQLRSWYWPYWPRKYVYSSSFRRNRRDELFLWSPRTRINHWVHLTFYLSSVSWKMSQKSLLRWSSLPGSFRHMAFESLLSQLLTGCVKWARNPCYKRFISSGGLKTLKDRRLATEACIRWWNWFTVLLRDCKKRGFRLSECMCDVATRPLYKPWVRDGVMTKIGYVS